MGIEVERFSGDFHQQFICSVCLDVVEDPVITPCDHLFCKSCFTSGCCPECRQSVQQTKPMNRILRNVYESLKIKCLSNDCHEEILVSNYKNHDKTCAKAYKGCQTCGCSSPDHDCIEFLSQRVFALQLQLEEKRSNDLVSNQEARKRGTIYQLFWYSFLTVAWYSILIVAWYSFLTVAIFLTVKCGIVFKVGERFYKCRTCSVVKGACLCEDCFRNGNHFGHEYYSDSEDNYGAFCDCGDKKSFAKGRAHCSKHKHEENSYFHHKN